MKRLAFLVSVLLLSPMMSVTKAFPQTVTIFGNATPKTPADPDTNAVTLGVKFYTIDAGSIKGIRFYRAVKSPTGYVARLYTASGSMLASASMSSEPCATLPCWEELDFASPISIAANTTYVAAYFAPGAQYPDDQNGLANGVTSGPLVAPASGASGGNGVYHYGTSIGFPNQVWNASNYWVDVAFIPSAPTLQMSFNPPNPTIPANAVPGTAVASVTVTWTDGSPFTGTLSFAAPNGNDNATFALSGNNIVVNPSGPGVGADGGTTQNVTIQAAQ
jgi:uncharacterized protein DUF4082